MSQSEVVALVCCYRCVFCGRGTVWSGFRAREGLRRPSWSVLAPCPGCGRLGTMEEMGEPEAFVVPVDEIPKFMKGLRELVEAEFGELTWKAES